MLPSSGVTATNPSLKRPWEVVIGFCVTEVTLSSCPLCQDTIAERLVVYS